MRTTSLLALGVALTLGAGLAPATAATSSPSDRAARLDQPRVAPADRSASLERLAEALTADAAALPPAGSYFRIGGANRYATAVAVSQDTVCGRTETDCPVLGGVDAPVDTVFVANGLDFPDALGAGPVASGLGPLLLVPPSGTVPAVVKNELARIQPMTIVVFGGTGAVSAGVASQLAAYGTVERVAGANRYDTAAEAALVNDELWGEEGLSTVVLASGEGFADALAGGGAAANTQGSLMLTRRSSLPAETLAALQTIQPPTVIVLGGTGVVSTGVENAVRAALPASTVVRASGSDRFGTAIALSKRVFPGVAGEVFVVNGFNFPDALASAPAAGLWGASTLLARAQCVTAATRAEAVRLDPVLVTGFGGTGVLSDNALALGTC